MVTNLNRNYLNLNYFLRFISLTIVAISQFYIFNQISSEYSIHSWIFISIYFLLNIFFIFVGNNKNLAFLGLILETILGCAFLYISKNPFVLLLSFMIPSVTSVQYFNNYIKYLGIIVSIFFSFVGLLGIFNLFSDPLFPNLLVFLGSNFLLSILIISAFFIMEKIMKEFILQIESYKEQNELLVSNISELENRISEYEKEVEILKNDLEQEKLAFDVEIQKLIKDFQDQKNETYTQLKVLNNEMILKDKTISELKQVLDNLNLDIEDLRKNLTDIRDIIYILSENISVITNLYKTSEFIVNLISKYINYDTLVIFLKNDSEDRVDTFLISGENSEFYYEYKKIEFEELYRLSFIEGNLAFASKDENSVVKPFYPKEKLAIAVPLSVNKERIGIMYISYLDLEKSQYINKDFLVDLVNIIAIIIYFSITYSKSMNRVIWDERIFCYSTEFIWEFINNISFYAQRYNEYFSIVLISFDPLIGKDINDFTKEDFTMVKEVNVAIKSSLRESDLISFIGNGIIMIVLSRIDKTKIDVVCNRIKSVVDNKLKTLGYNSVSYLVCSTYPYENYDISKLIDLSLKKLMKNIESKRAVLEFI